MPSRRDIGGDGGAESRGLRAVSEALNRPATLAGEARQGQDDVVRKRKQIGRRSQ